MTSKRDKAGQQPPADDPRVRRLQAQLVNQGRQHEREMENATAQARLEGLRLALDALQDLATAISHHPDDPHLKALHDSCLRRLESAGAKQIPARVYDPLLHQIADVQSVPGMAHGVVIDVLQPGWQYGPRLLRPAYVIVNRIESAP